MTKLHELLAAETNLENQANKCRTDLVGTFQNKRHHFEEKKEVFTPSVETVRDDDEIDTMELRLLEFAGLVAQNERALRIAA